MVSNKCSRAGCEQIANFAFDWRNPNVHRDGRFKTWGSCQSHREFFSEYLGSRGFLIAERAL